MGSRNDILKNLGIPEYPWSSEDVVSADSINAFKNKLDNWLRTSKTVLKKNDEEAPSDPRPPPITQTRPSDQAASSSSSGNQNISTRNEQARELFLSLLNVSPRNNPSGNSSSDRLNYRAHSDLPFTYLSRTTHTPAPELRERPSERADLDIQRVLAFKRLTRNVNNGHRYNRYAVPRGHTRPGSVVPSEANSSSVRLPYHRRVYRNPPTNNIPGSARQIVVDHSQQRPSSAVPPRRRTFGIGAHNSDDDAEEAAPPTLRSIPLPPQPPLPAPAPAPAPEQSSPERNNDPDAQVSSNDISAISVALEEEIVEIVDEPPSDIDLDNSRAVLPSSSDLSNDPNLASTSRSDEIDAGTEQLNHGVKRKRHDSAEDKPAEQFTVMELNQSLLRLLECPVCLEWMEPPMSQCRRGHLVCNRCRARLASCPVCRTTFSSVRNRAMEGVAEMLRYPCRHGCGREVRLRKRAPHEASCAARKYLCPAPLCADRLPLPRDQLADHFHSKHMQLVKLGARHHFGIKVNSEAHENWLIMALDEFFHMKVDVDIRTWGVIVYVAYIGPKCNAMDFAYEVTIDGQHNSRKMSYKRATHSDLESSSLNVSRQDCFHLTLDQALNFIRFKNRHCDAEKYLEFEVEISRIDPPPSRDDSDS